MSRPNILWIVTTQWRVQSCGWAGDPDARTPWLDGLASEATDYCQAVTPHPLGPQARAALLTGKLCPANGVTGYWDRLPAKARTVAHALRDRGYATAFFGKWHLSVRDRTAPLVGEAHAKQAVPPEGRGGFALWEGFESGFLLNDPWLHGTRLSEPRRFKGYQADVLTQRAAEWITGTAQKRAQAGEPYFCVVSLEAPHPPYHAPAPHVVAPDPASLHLRRNVPVGGDAEKQARAELAGYLAHIEATDRAVGRLLAEVDLGETAVVFTSVHGDMHGSHGLFRKAWPHEESVRVPLLVRLPGAKQRTRNRDESPVSLMDLPHLAVHWAEGRTWRCKRDSAAISMPAATELPHQCPWAWRGFRSPEHKLVLRVAADGTESPWLFHDLRADPFELRNLAEDPASEAEIARLRAWL
jgi:arylsulfatase A-like enzyme